MFPPNIAVFECPTSRGKELASAIISAAERRGFTVIRQEAWTTEEYFRACLSRAAVVADMSLDPDGTDAAYRQVSILPALLDHVLFVSRTPLPVNFVPARKGGSPPYPYPFMELVGESRFEWGNEEIVAWVERQFDDPALMSGPRLTPGEAERVRTLRAPELYAAFVDEVLERRSRPPQEGVFVSYRTPDVARVREALVRLGVDADAVRMIPPGAYALDRELLSEARRWMVLGLIQDEISRVAEVWAARSDTYHQSWWTLGELVMAASIDAFPGRRAPAVRVLDLQTPSTASDPALVIHVNDAARATLNRRLTHTRPETAGIERHEAIRKQKELLDGKHAEAFLQFARNAVKSPLFESLFSSLPTRPETLFSDAEAQRQFTSDPVFTEEFWFDLAIERFYVTGERSPYPLTAGALIASSEELVSFAADEVQRACREGVPARSKDGRYAVHVLEAPPRHLWYASVPGVSHPGVRSFPTYLLAETR